jgi:hypothetical protein
MVKFRNSSSEATRGAPPQRCQPTAPGSRRPPSPPPSLAAAAPHNRRQRVSSSSPSLPLLRSPLPMAMQLLPDVDLPVPGADPAVTHALVIRGGGFSVGWGGGFEVDLAVAVAPWPARDGGPLNPVTPGTDSVVPRADLAAATAAVRDGGRSVLPRRRRRLFSRLLISRWGSIPVFALLAVAAPPGAVGSDPRR